MDVTLSDMVAEARKLSDRINEGVRLLSAAGRKEAEAERDYRRLRAVTFAQVKTEGDRTAAHLEAEVDGRCADARFVRDVARSEARAALEALRSRRQQISSLQSILSAHKAEAGHAFYGPSETP
jgi:hypothetical protein